LIEPEQPAPTVDLGSVDTGRILRDTGSIMIPGEPNTPPESENHEPGEPAGEPDGSAPITAEVAPRRSDLNVLSVIAVVLALALSPFAMVFGYVAVGQIRQSQQRGEALAWVAVGLGWLWTVGYVVVGSVLGVTWLQL
jgi:hypothetical protein